MTANQIAYWNLQEQKRANLAKERETERSNLAREQETHRSNRKNETLKGVEIVQDGVGTVLDFVAKENASKRHLQGDVLKSVRTIADIFG